MSTVTVKRAKALVLDIRDSSNGIYTQATVDIFRNDGYKHDGIHISFNHDYAGMDYSWLQPGQNIEAFLRRINFDYTLGKLLSGRNDELRDIDAMNDAFYEFLQADYLEHYSVCTQPDVDYFLDDLKEEISSYVDDESSALADEVIRHMSEVDAFGEHSEAREQIEYIDSALERYEEQTVYKQKYLHFWHHIWPAFIDEVAVYLKESQGGATAIGEGDE